MSSNKIVPGKQIPADENYTPVAHVDKELGYVVRIPFRHSYSWGGSQKIETIEYRTKSLTGSPGVASDELFRVLESLGYWKDGKPTPAAAALRDPRNSHVQVLAFGVHVAPGPIHSTSDRRFQAMIAEI
jgi:hypothetical protein